MEAMGDVDFYPNKGEGQPGCPTSVLDRFTAAFYSTLGNAVACSHFRVLDLYMATINNVCPDGSLSAHSLRINWADNIDMHDKTEQRAWIACQAGDSCPWMGYNLDPESIARWRESPEGAGGSLLVAMQTSDSWPFCFWPLCKACQPEEIKSSQLVEMVKSSQVEQNDGRRAKGRPKPQWYDLCQRMDWQTALRPNIKLAQDRVTRRSVASQPQNGPQHPG
ncbi:inactive pancreatic lipase-related protein [Elysia marginata]|uniref:Inactive pancreatic lipase-related protein n=1 Tax=Elysia marginata TaxID=1093978 RepID=A0AAV4GXL3_9GAST|nr:inactive pancreatic lipase-related protein [Elysia marginata]